MISFNMMPNLDVDRGTQCNLYNQSIPIPTSVSQMLMGQNFNLTHEMRPEEQAQKFHIDDVWLPRSG